MGFIKQVSMASAFVITLAVPSVAQDTPNADTVLATVNGTTITLGHLVAIASGLPAQYNEVPVEQLFNGILDQLIQQTLLEANFPVNEKKMQLALDNERRALASGEAIEKIAEAAVTEEAVQKLYEENIAKSEPSPEYQASHILVKTEKEANEILKMLEDGADFATLAKEKSTGPSGPSGGDLGWFGPGAMVPEFDQAVSKMKVGEFVGPVKTQFGHHVIILNDQRDHPSLDTQRQALVEELGSKAIDIEIARLEAEAKVEKIAPAFDLSVIRDSNILN
jgi:peptidyl-prolyl cis-trans isomerase C